ncbi:hypothetical protein SpCBS45565_g04988 [Spizellomyces sp. 'palustris']|nr:hypothetical protein SpCBS45565_g04988 [Spizellomyces sp. 'palustris']
MPYAMQNITSNYKYLGTLILAVLGWFFAFIGICILQSQYDDIKDGLRGRGKNPLSAAWFHLFFYLFTLLGVAAVLITTTLEHYRTALVAILAIGFVFITSDLDSILGDISLPGVTGRTKSGGGLLAAGLFFLSFAYLPWIFFFGSSEKAFVNNMNNDNSFVFTMPRINTRFGARNGPGAPGVAPAVPPQDYTGPRESAISPVASQVPPYAVDTDTKPSVTKANALFPYEANPEDPTEVSFAKGDLLEVLSNQGKWWQVRTPTGAVGIAPSNYLQII